MSAKVFVDTNILVYAYDETAGGKQEKAAKLVSQLWDSPLLPAISVQVLQELYVTLTRKGVSVRDAERIVTAYMEWDVIENSSALLTASFEEQQKYKLSFWDASILAAARSAACAELLSEDFNSGQDYGGIKAIDPLGR